MPKIIERIKCLFKKHDYIYIMYFTNDERVCLRCGKRASGGIL